MRLWCAVIALSGAVIAVSPAQAYEEAPVENGGTIKGKITYAGRVPTRTILPTKDQQVCGQMREEPEVRVGPDGGVQDAIVYLVEVERGKAWPAEAKEPVLDNKDCVFHPHVQAIPSGALGVHNSDPVLHNTHGFYGKRTAFNIALPNQGQTIDVDLERTRAGAHRVRCARVDARLGVRGRQPVLRGDRGGWHVRDHRRAAGRVHPGRQPGIHRARGGRGRGRGWGDGRGAGRAQAALTAIDLGRSRKRLRKGGGEGQEADDELGSPSRRAGRRAAEVREFQKARREMRRVLWQPGVKLDNKVSISRRIFLNRALLGGTAAAARPPGGCRGSTLSTWHLRRRAVPPRPSSSPGSPIPTSIPRTSTPASSRRRCARSRSSGYGPARRLAIRGGSLLPTLERQLRIAINTM